MDIRKDEMNLSTIDEAEALVYSQIFGAFDMNKGDFVSVRFNSENEIDLKDEVLWKSDEDEKYDDGMSDLTYELTSGVLGEDSMEMEKEAREQVDKRNEINKLISVLSEKEISSMVVTLKLNGITEEYVTDEKAGEKYLPKEAQIDKIKKTIEGFKNIVIVYSQEELSELQEEFKQRHEKEKPSVEKSLQVQSNDKKEPEIKTQVYIRISEEDYEAVKNSIGNENINVVSNKVTTRGDKKGINIIVKAADANKVRNMLYENKISILQDVDGNVDWESIKEISNKFENVTVEQLREFQKKNNDKFSYIAFRKDDIYTIFVDKKCDIAIDASERKTMKQIESKVEKYKNNSLNNNSNNKNKGKNSKEER